MTNKPIINLPFFSFELVFDLKETDANGENKLSIVPKLRYGSSQVPHSVENPFSKEELQQAQSISDYVNEHLADVLLDAVSMLVGEATIRCNLNPEYVRRFNPQSKNKLHRILGRMVDPEKAF